jgi:hypothetical protein
VSDEAPDSDLPDSDRRRLRRRRARADAAPPADPWGWRSAGIVAGIAAVLVVAGLVAPAPASDDAQEAAVQPVDSSAAVCPEPGSVDGARTTSVITVVPGLEGQDRAGEASIGYLEGVEGTGDGSSAAPADDDAPVEAETVGGLAQPGDVARVVAEQTRLPALEVRTTGGLAPGLVAAQSTQDSFSAGRGLSSQACLGPDTTWWFVGGGSTAGRESQLVLVNAESTPAELEIAISGPDGPVSTPRLRGLVVEPRSRVVVRLFREAPRLPGASWRVTVRQGRVMAALSDRLSDGFVPRGADWVPASVDPATRVLIPGVIGGPGGRQLLVHAPGDLSATVRVRLITAAGSFVPAATPEIEVPGGAVVSVALDSALQGDDATVDLQSDLPIVAGVRQVHPAVDASEGSLEDISFTAGAPLIDTISSVTGLPAERSTGVTVWMTAPDDVITIERAPEMPDMSAEDVSASPLTPSLSGSPVAPAGEVTDDASASPVSVTLRILGVSSEGEPLPETEEITASVPRGRLVAVDIPRPEGAAWFTVVATVSGGEVVMAHRVVRRNKDGSLVTGYPWRPLRTSVVVPRAVPDPGLAIAGP